MHARTHAPTPAHTKKQEQEHKPLLGQGGETDVRAELAVFVFEEGLCHGCGAW